MLPAPTRDLGSGEMTGDDMSNIAMLDLGGSRSPSDWVERNRRNHDEHGFGLWIIETHAGDFVGDCGLTMQEVEGTWHVEAGWHVRDELRSSWLAQ